MENYFNDCFEKGAWLLVSAGWREALAYARCSAAQTSESALEKRNLGRSRFGHIALGLGRVSALG